METNPAMRNLLQRVPLFWVLQIAGWGSYGLTLFLATLPYLGLRDFVAYRSVFSAACFAVSFVMHRVCRKLWRDRAPWPRVLPTIVVFSYAAGYLCSVAAYRSEIPFLAKPPTTNLWMAPVTGGFNAGFILMAWCGLYFGVKYYQALEAESRRALAAEASAREAELRALRYQIHPHFLFNTLNAISTLVVEGNGPNATRMIARLADFFRATLDGDAENEVPLEDEVFLAEQYLEIEKIRLGDRLQVRFDVAPAVLPAFVPHLLLQPLVENAVRHGIASNPAGGALLVRAEQVGSRLRISIADSSLGRASQAAQADTPMKPPRTMDVAVVTEVTEERVATKQMAATQPIEEETRAGDELSPNPQSNGIGLANTRNRLAQLYGDDYSFELHRPAAGGCEVVIEIPLRTDAPPFAERFNA